MDDLQQLKVHSSTQTNLKRFNIKRIEACLVNNYYIVFIIAYMLSVFADIRPAVLLFAYNAIIILFRLLQGKILFNYLLLFPVLCGFSFVGYLWNGLPFSVFIESFLYVVTPMVYCFASKNEHVNLDKFFRAFLVAILINNIFGILCFYLKPGFYMAFLQRSSQTALAQVTHISGSGRLVTIFGSIETGALAAIGFIVSVGLLIKNEKNVVIILSLIVDSVAVILTQQRGPIFTCIFVLLFLIIYSLKQQLLKPKYIITIIISAIGVLIALSFWKPTVFVWIVERVTNPSDAINERTGYQFDVIRSNNSIVSWLIGNGLGSREIFAYEFGTDHNVILDQMYFNVLGELGIVGVLCFIGLLLSSLFKGLKDIKQYFIPTFIAFEIAFIGLGTTLLYYPQLMPIFWLSIGMIYYKKTIQQ